MNGQIRVPLWVVRLVLALLVVATVAFVPAPREAIGAVYRGVFDPQPVATSAAFAEERAFAERAIQRAIERGAEQLRRTRALTLPITQQEAAAIEARSLDELKGVRRAALSSLADAFGLRDAPLIAYVTDAEQRLDRGVSASEEAPILLAPTVARIIQQTNDLVGPIADRGTREMAAPRGASPSPSPIRTSSPSPVR